MDECIVSSKPPFDPVVTVPKRGPSSLIMEMFFFMRDELNLMRRCKYRICTSYYEGVIVNITLKGVLVREIQGTKTVFVKYRNLINIINYSTGDSVYNPFYNTSYNVEKVVLEFGYQEIWG